MAWYDVMVLTIFNTPYMYTARKRAAERDRRLADKIMVLYGMTKVCRGLLAAKAARPGFG